MKIFKSITLESSVNACLNCVHFQSEPGFIEKAFPGLTTMSSGFASVRDQDGLCTYNQIYLSARDSCPGFTPHTTAVK